MSIYDSIGGAGAVRAAADDFHARVLADPRLAPFFTGTDLNSDAGFDAVVEHLVGTLTGLGVPAETTGQIGSALAPLRSDIVAARELAG